MANENLSYGPEDQEGWMAVLSSHLLNEDPTLIFPDPTATRHDAVVEEKFYRALGVNPSVFITDQIINGKDLARLPVYSENGPPAPEIGRFRRIINVIGRVASSIVGERKFRDRGNGMIY